MHNATMQSSDWSMKACTSHGQHCSDALCSRTGIRGRASWGDVHVHLAKRRCRSVRALRSALSTSCSVHEGVLTGPMSVFQPWSYRQASHVRASLSLCSLAMTYDAAR